MINKLEKILLEFYDNHKSMCRDYHPDLDIRRKIRQMPLDIAITEIRMVIEQEKRLKEGQHIKADINDTFFRR